MCSTLKNASQKHENVRRLINENLWHLPKVKICVTCRSPTLTLSYSQPLLFSEQNSALACYNRSHCSPSACSSSMKLQRVVTEALTLLRSPAPSPVDWASHFGVHFPPSGPSTNSGGLLAETPFWPQNLGNKWQSIIKFLHRASRRIFWAKREPLGSKRHSPMLMLSSGNFPCSFLSRKFLK